MASFPSIRQVLSLKGVLGQRLGARLWPIAGPLISTAFVAAALALRLALSPWLAGAQFITFFPAVIAATLLCGAVPGLLAVVLSAAASTLVTGTAEFSLPQLYTLLMFVVVAVADVAIISALLSANAALKTSIGHVGRLNADLRLSEARFRDLIESAPDAMIIADRDERVALVNAEAERMFGRQRGELVGRPITELMPEEFREAHRGQIAGFLAAARLRRMGYGRELFGIRRDGTRFPIETNLSVLAGADGALVSSVIRDISSRRQAEERQALLIRELNHRVKNTLSNVQAIVHQTLKSAKDPQSFSDALTARLAALSQSHDVLTRNDWSGGHVRDIAMEQLSPYGRGNEGRFRLTGPDLMLSPNRAVTLGMVLGELATNAAKYGALSDGGAVEVAWTLHQVDGKRWLRLVWSEHGGPAVEQPTTRGFGTRLIERSVGGGLGGSAEVRFAPEGVSCEINFPLQDTET